MDDPSKLYRHFVELKIGDQLIKWITVHKKETNLNYCEFLVAYICWQFVQVAFWLKIWKYENMWNQERKSEKNEQTFTWYASKSLKFTHEKFEQQIIEALD